MGIIFFKIFASNALTKNGEKCDFHATVTLILGLESLISK